MVSVDFDRSQCNAVGQSVGTDVLVVKYASILFKSLVIIEPLKGVQENDVSVKLYMFTVLLLTMVQVLYLLEVFILAHYGPPSTETPTTETTTVQCRKNS